MATSLCLFGGNAALAALSATTASTIEGSAPYLTFDGGTTKATDTSSLLGITLSDGTAYTQLTNSSSALSPIELPVAGQTIDNIDMLVPVGQTSVSLNSLIGAPYNYFGDADGDGNATATGTLSLSIKDANGNAVSRNTTLEPCKSPYAVTLTSTAGNLTTLYGAPNSTAFNGANTTYYIKPKVVTPYACWARPNLANNNGTQPEWDGSKGFKLRDINTPSSNFPTMGFNKAYFDITVAGETAANVIAAMGTTVNGSTPTSGVNLTLSAQGTNVVRVTLEGPSHSSPGAFTSNTFKLYSDAGKTNLIYSFTLSKWFIAKPVVFNTYFAALGHCATLPGNYRVPSVGEYTNARLVNGVANWPGTLPGWTQNKYARAIGGGLFAEWGYTYNVYYSGSDFESYAYWAFEQAGSTTKRHLVSSNDGPVYYDTPSGSPRKVACVSP